MNRPAITIEQDGHALRYERFESAQDCLFWRLVSVTTPDEAPIEPRTAYSGAEVLHQCATTIVGSGE